MECNSVFETGVRGVVSSWAFKRVKKQFTITVFCNDIEDCDVDLLLKTADKLIIDCRFVKSNNLDLEFDQKYDLTFIDTWHVYAQLSRELEKFKSITNKYIVLHDTTIDGIYGESLRFNHDIELLSKNTGYSKEEIKKGLWPAVEDFLIKTQIELFKRYTNNNGLTILKVNENK